eukprot:TRINITY_DN4967_c0_g1_i1.p1 TRINITY_DN4967_c0_g1~~TRINITY_DN4967_c0_g1_i1.p1  ORF type:complete len:1143 (+),score=322.34 TRINITY_DN4967_c0_g1_i1:141-3569(+)
MTILKEEDIQQIDKLCVTKFQSPDGAARKYADDELQRFQNVSQLPTLQEIMERSQNPYSQFFVALVLIEIVNSKWNSSEIDGGAKVVLRTWLLSTLMRSGPQMTKFVLRGVIDVLARVTKLGWLESEVHQKLPQDVQSMFLPPPSQGGSPVLQTIGLMLLKEVVQEISTYHSRRMFSVHRRTSWHFKDTALLQIFVQGLDMLRAVRSGEIGDPQLFELAMSLVHTCLTFDFVAGCSDEASDEAGAVYIPANWRATLVAPVGADETRPPEVLVLLWEVYACTATLPAFASIATDALRCLVQLAGVRRNLFASDSERMRWLTALMQGVTDVLTAQPPIGLRDPDNFHEICRLLARFRPTFQLTEIVQPEVYPRWISVVCDFTLAAFNAWSQTSQSHPLLLSLWMRLVTAIPFLRPAVTTNIEQLTAQVILQYINTRTEMCEHFAANPRNASEETAVDPLVNMEQLTLQLDHVSMLVRSCFNAVGPALYEKLQAKVSEYAAALQQPNASQIVGQPQVLQMEAALAWLTSVAAVVISHHSHPNTNLDLVDAIDAQMTRSVLALSDLLVKRAQLGNLTVNFARTECAVVFYFQFFRRLYLAHPAVQAYRVLAELGKSLNPPTGSLQPDGAVNQEFLLTVIVNKLVSNLQTWGGALHAGMPQMVVERVVRETLILLQEHTYSSSSGAMIPAVRELLNNHSEARFPFLLPPPPHLPTRQRSGLLRVLTNLLFSESTREQAFEEFLGPQRQVLARLAERLTSLNPADAPTVAQFRADFSTPDARGRIVGLMRDLRGVAWAADKKVRYGMLFKILFPYLPMLKTLMAVVASDPPVANILMKFVGDFAVNRMQRIAFDSSSPDGILLFKHTAALVQTFLQHHYNTLPPPQDVSSFGPDYVPKGVITGVGGDLYKNHLRGITAAMTALQWALTGQYCNFGIFTLYNDPVLLDVLQVSLPTMLKVGVEAIFAYPKFGAAYFNLLETVCMSHISHFVSLPPAQFHVFLRILEVATASVILPKTTVTSAACSVGHIAAHVVQNQKEGSTIQAYLASVGDEGVWSRLMISLFNILLYDEHSQWNVARPLLPLITLAQNQFREYRQQVCSTVSGGKREKLDEAFEKLFTGVGATLDPESRERFVANVMAFRPVARSIL